MDNHVLINLSAIGRLLGFSRQRIHCLAVRGRLGPRVRDCGRQGIYYQVTAVERLAGRTFTREELARATRGRQ